MSIDNFPCKCGHKKKLHGFKGNGNDLWCAGNTRPISEGFYPCCHDCDGVWAPDNLQYLEVKFKGGTCY